MEELIERDISQAERDKMDAGDFAGPDKSFPIATASDVESAAHLVGKAADPAAVKAKIISIANKKGFHAALPAAWCDSGDCPDHSPDAQDESVKPYLDSDIVPLAESAMSDDGLIGLKIISPGWGSSGYYPADVLQKDGPKAWRAGTQMYLDHPTESESRERPERSIRDLAAVIATTPEYREKGNDGPGLYARAQVLPQYRETIKALAPHIGVSIRAHGSFSPGEAEGRKGRIINHIASGESVDFVTKAGAGGKVLALMESIRVAAEANCDSDLDESGHTPSSNEAADAATPTEVDSMELKEAQDRIAALETKLAESEGQVIEAEARAIAAEEAVAASKTAKALSEAEVEARKFLADIDLPDASKVRLVAEAKQHAVLTDGMELDTDKLHEALTAAAKTEAEYVEAVRGMGKIQGHGRPAKSIDAEDEVKESAAKHFGGFFGMSEAVAKLAVQGR